MKKIILSIILGLSFLSFAGKCYGQFNTTADASHDSLTFNADTAYTFSNTIKNVGQDSIYINWHIDFLSSSVPIGWSVAPCDNDNCYGYVSTTHMSNKIAPDSIALWTVKIDPTGGGIGTAWVTERMIDNNGDSSRAVVFILTKSTTGVSKTMLPVDDVVLYPNPAKNDVNIIFNGSLNIHSVAIYNLIGKVVAVFKTAGNSANLNIENLPSGIYFLRMMDANSNVVTTRKFTKG